MNEKCFALKKHNGCSVLNVSGCEGTSRCPFYKPKWLFIQEQQKASARLRSLDESTQQYIEDKYYGGKKRICQDRSTEMCVREESTEIVMGTSDA